MLVRHLLLAPCGFQELRRRTGIAPRVLSARLRQLQADGLVAREDGERGIYAVTSSAHDLAPVVSALARWYVLHAVEDLELDLGRFSETSAQSILESLPFLLREDARAGVHLVFEIRLTGAGGGVWSVAIDDGACRVALGFARERRRPIHGRDARLVRRRARLPRPPRRAQARPPPEGGRPRGARSSSSIRSPAAAGGRRRTR